MKKFRTIRTRAEKRKGGADAMAAMLPTPASKASIRKKPTHRFLAEMSKHIFASGFRWKVVEAKWSDIEEAFFHFDVGTVAAFDGKDVAGLLDDARVIRHRGKIEAIVDNARFILEVGRFGALVADWPETEIVDLWARLKKEGRLLGGKIGPRFLRGVGKDTFILSDDVVACLIEAGVVDAAPTSKAALKKVQAAFNTWREETGLPLCQLSKVASMSTGANYGVV